MKLIIHCPTTTNTTGYGFPPQYIYKDFPDNSYEYEHFFNNNQTFNLLNKKPMELTTYLKRQLDRKTRKLYKAGLIDGNLSLTEKGRELLIAILYFEHKDELVKEAEEILEKEKNKK